MEGLLLALWILSPFLAVIIARRKDRSALSWFLVTLLFSPALLLILLALPPLAAPPPPTRSCPYCAETVLMAASICKHCGRDLPPQTAATATAMGGGLDTKTATTTAGDPAREWLLRHGVEADRPSSALPIVGIVGAAAFAIGISVFVAVARSSVADRENGCVPDESNTQWEEFDAKGCLKATTVCSRLDPDHVKAELMAAIIKDDPSAQLRWNRGDISDFYTLDRITERLRALRSKYGCPELSAK